MYICTHTHIYTHVHANTQTYTYKHTHVHIHTRVHHKPYRWVYLQLKRTVSQYNMYMYVSHTQLNITGSIVFGLTKYCWQISVKKISDKLLKSDVFKK